MDVLIQKTQTSLHFTLTTLLLIGFGCAPADPLNRQEVSGTVALGGEPIAEGAIEFVSPEFISGAPIQDGKFKISKELGLPPGEYTVRITAPDRKSRPELPGDAPGDTKLPKDLIPDEFNRKSQLKQTIEAGKANRITIEIPTGKKHSASFGHSSSRQLCAERLSFR